MSLWRQIIRGVHVLAHRSAADRDVADEVQHYLDETTAALIANGRSTEDARRAARMELGNATLVREEVRAQGWENAVATLLADLRYSARRLRDRPGFTTVNVLTLALGIGASTAIFSAVNPILFESLPYPDAGRIMMISDFGPEGTPQDVTFGTYLELAARSRSFDAIAVLKAWQPSMASDAEPERLSGQRVSAGYFRALGLSPILGRDFQPSDDRPDGPRVVVLSDRLWRRLGADRAIVGREIKLDDNGYMVIGVMPRDFENVLASSAEIWTPLQYSTALSPDGREWGHHLRMVARRRRGVGIDHARQELQMLAHSPLAEFPRVPWASLDQGLIVNALQHEVTRDVRPALLAVLGAVTLVLLISCVNVANLLLARGAQRRGEFAMRAALGAGRMRLVRQVLTETLLLAAIGGAVGMIAAEAGVRALVALSPPGLPRLSAMRVDGAVFAFGVAITTSIGVLVGIIPALHASRADLQVGLHHSSPRATAGHRVTRGALVVTEVALALVVLVIAGLLLRSVERLFAVAVGFEPSRLLTMQVQVSGRQYGSDAARYRFFSQLLDEVRRVPGVTAAAATSQLPLSGDRDGYGVHFESDHGLNDDNSALRYTVTPGYFETMRIPLRSGRLLDAHDISGAPRAALINESFAKRRFPGRDPIGQRIRFGPDEGEWYTIAGVTGDVKQASLAMGEEDAVYVTMPQWHWVDNVMSLVVRARADNAAALAAAVRNAIWSIDKDQPIARVATMDDLLEKSEANRRFALILFEAFGLVALVLAAIGIYGLLSGGVAERMREIGVRSALGASRGTIVALVVRQGMTLAGAGVLIGLAGAAIASRAIVTLLFGISRLDPVTYLGVIALLITAAMMACCLPAWRAAQIDPASTLRAE
ncbi:MAG TPA: ABC transporter permease [Vicinamibacterales bacterium]|nr:ABC transporter permease [Vicinamibacterales bacterium]